MASTGCQRFGWGLDRGSGAAFLPAPLPDLAGGAHRVEHTGDDLRRAGAPHLVGALGLEQFGVGEDDPELVVQAMKEQAEVARVVAGRAGAVVGCRHHEASLRVSSPARPGSRQSVSTKMRTEPPAVRTYSTLPPAIQL